MRMLLTSDHDMQAGGIQGLRRAILGVPGVDLVTIAPDGNRSAIGRGITTRAPLSVERVDFEDGTHGFQTDGTRWTACGSWARAVEGWKADLVSRGSTAGRTSGTT